MAKPLQHQILVRALEIVSHEKTWARGAIARTAGGHACPYWDAKAVRFCAVGAILRAAFELVGGYPDTALVESAECHVLAANDMKTSGLPCINDSEGREAVVAMFKVALAH